MNVWLLIDRVASDFFPKNSRTFQEIFKDLFLNLKDTKNFLEDF